MRLVGTFSIAVVRSLASLHSVTHSWGPIWTATTFGTERSRREFFDSSIMRTDSQSRAEIEYPRARVPYIAGCELSAATVLRNAAQPNYSNRCPTAYGSQRVTVVRRKSAAAQPTMRSTIEIVNRNGSDQRYTRSHHKASPARAMTQHCLDATLRHAEHRFRRIRGFQEMPRLILAPGAPAVYLQPPQAPTEHPYPRRSPPSVSLAIGTTH